ncbi:hypothetical protein C0J52_15639 [Blattella germanica]|nr:hypothetical protein C0J52_15639 [Blattella germanica]
MKVKWQVVVQPPTRAAADIRAVLERPSSQISYLDKFLKESSTCRAGSIESEEGDVEDNPSLASSKSNLSELSIDPNIPQGLDPNKAHHLGPHLPPKPKSHQFLVRTFSSPTKCSHCTSLMVGLTRQGVVCEVCGFACHIGCCEKVPAICPVPSDQRYVKVPKTGGVKKGWVRQFVVVCDFKLFLYDISPDRNALPSVYVSQVLDMRDEEFAVSSVRDSDVIHATKKDIPCIFRVFRAKELLDNTLALIKNAMSGAIVDPDRLVIGTEEGLFCLDLDRSEIARVGEGKKVYQLEYVVEEQLLVVLSGKQRHVRLIPVRALDGDDVEWIKVAETKGCITFATGVMRRSPQLGYCLCVAIKRQNTSQVIIYEVTRTKTRHKRLREVMLPTQAQTLNILSEGRLCVGYQSGFSIYSIMGDQHPLCFCDGHLLVYSETHVDVFNCATGEWVQTINVKRAKPLNGTGTLSICVINDMPHIIYLNNVHQRELINVTQCDGSGRPMPRPRRRTDRRSKMISAPTNFNHISHMGPGDGIQIQRLLDLPTTVETADQSLASPQQLQGSQQRLFHPTKMAHPPPRHPSHSEQRRMSGHMQRTSQGYSGHNGSTSSRRSAAPPRPAVTPPSLPRSPDGPPGDSEPSGPHHHPPLSLGSVPSLHEVCKDQGSPRHSIASNNSSNPSTPPSPGHDHGSSSYDS